MLTRDRCLHPSPAEKWEATPDLRNGPSSCVKASLHFGYGEFTRAMWSFALLMLRPEAIAAMVGFWRSVEEIK